MSNSIWKTDGLREASTKKLILYFAGGGRIPYTGWNHPGIMMLSASNESWWNYTDVMRWCYVDDLIAQADKAERLEEENEAMREEFEVWHGNHKCVLEDNERLQKAVDKAIWILEESKKVQRPDFKLGFTYCLFPQPHLDIILDEIKQLIKE